MPWSRPLRLHFVDNCGTSTTLMSCPDDWVEKPSDHGWGLLGESGMK